MGNTSKRKPIAARAPLAPRVDLPRLAVVRSESGTVEVFNIDHIVQATFTYRGIPLLVIETIGDVLAIKEGREDVDPTSLHGVQACDLAAHLILAGHDVEGAADALERARPGMYPEINAAHERLIQAAIDRELAREALPVADCDACAYRSHHGDPCALESRIEEDGKCADFDDVHKVDPVRDALDRFDEVGGGCACLTPPPPPPTGAIDAERSACAYGENCKRFPRCGDCSLYALDVRAEPASHADAAEVAGESIDELARRVGACEVFCGLQRLGAIIGKQFCAVGHDMKDPMCVLCPFLRPGDTRP